MPCITLSMELPWMERLGKVTAIFRNLNELELTFLAEWYSAEKDDDGEIRSYLHKDDMLGTVTVTEVANDRLTHSPILR